jgi:hypothetical protein
MTLSSPLSLPRLVAGLLLVLLLALPGPAQASLLHLEGPVPQELGVHGGSLSPCAAPAHCARADWPLPDPEAALSALVPVLEITEGVRIVATARCTGRTGVEMEALTAVSVAALTVYDMLKAVDRAIRIDGVRLLEKTGGRSGHWRAS